MMIALPGQPATAKLAYPLVPRPVVHANRDVRRRVGFLPLRHQTYNAVQRVRTLEQRPRAARLAVAQAVHDRLRPHLQVDDEVAIAQLLAIFEIDERAAAGADDLVLRRHDAAYRFAFRSAKALFTIFAKDFGDGAAGHLFDVSVAVDERQPQSSSDVATQRR